MDVWLPLEDTEETLDIVDDAAVEEGLFVSPLDGNFVVLGSCVLLGSLSPSLESSPMRDKHCNQAKIDGELTTRRTAAALDER